MFNVSQSKLCLKSPGCATSISPEEAEDHSPPSVAVPSVDSMGGDQLLFYIVGGLHPAATDLLNSPIKVCFALGSALNGIVYSITHHV